MHAKLRSALSRLGGADAIIMQNIAGEELDQGPYVYVAARAGFEPATLRTKGDESPNEPPRITHQVGHGHWLDTKPASQRRIARKTRRFNVGVLH